MRHWSQLATRNWRVRSIRTLGAVAAIALGVGAVVWVTCCYESVRQTIVEWATRYVGESHISLESPLGKYDRFAQRVIEKITPLEDVELVAPQLVQRLRVRAATQEDLKTRRAELESWVDDLPEIDLTGVDLAVEYRIRDWPEWLRTGRLLTPEDQDACVIEQDFAVENNLVLGDAILVWAGGRDKPYEIRIVGTVERRRIGRLQKGMALMPLQTLQNMTVNFGMINSLDIVLKDGDARNIGRVASRIHTAARTVVPNINMRSAEARLRQIDLAQSQQEVVLVLLSSVAMLTALFIILSTLSMGMIERIAQLGLLRCIGTTGRQLAALVMWEVMPLGLVGIVLGIPIGLALAALSVWIVPDYIGRFTISWNGIGLAVGAGAATTFIAAAIPALAAMRVSPMEAARPRARRAGLLPLAGVSLLAAAALAAQIYVMDYKVLRSPDFVQWASTAVSILYAVYAMAAPMAVWLISIPAVVVMAVLVGVRWRLLQDQVGHAVWRSAGICCGLMVGLSLIVGLAVFNESFRAGWQFPKQFPEAYVWSFAEMQPNAGDVAAKTPGVKSVTAANAMNAIVEEKPMFMEAVYRSVTWFLGVETDSFFDLVKLEFIEGDEETARRLMKEGGHILVASDFARARNKHLGDKVRVTLGSKERSFRVAGVIDSPALDIAAGYFQAQSEMRVVAVGSVIGTNADLRKHFQIDGVKLLLVNFDLLPAPAPADWPPPPGTIRGRRLSQSYYDERRPLVERWQRYREMQVLENIKTQLGEQSAFSGTARELKTEIDNELSRVTQLLTAVPAVALIVAALGVANLMTANVTSRAKQLAIMRAVGATRGQILRMVVGEALVLGLLGSALGLALGLHLAWNTTTMTANMWGFEVPFQIPWRQVGLAVGLTVGLCVVAGLLPARRAARTNVIEALHVP
ncbi:Macrolide export ATP-binding/permease protein MacB [Phycisphaerae bacterium RAS1]|nr:Macrolide export ATP-binding/permease protein MacB [Phycisphaerae bacterium RAS1]